MDSESKLGHSSALLVGPRVRARLAGPRRRQAEISLDSPSRWSSMYAEGSRRSASPRCGAGATTTAASTRRSTGPTASTSSASRSEGEASRTASGSSGCPRIVADADKQPEPWPVPNPFNVVPVVEIGVNRRLKPGGGSHARGEFEHCRGVIDRIHLLTFLGLVVAFWQGFPLRGVIGERSSATTTTTRWRRSTPTRARSRSSRTRGQDVRVQGRRPRQPLDLPGARAARGAHEDAAPLLPARAGDGEPLRRRDPRRRGRAGREGRRPQGVARRGLGGGPAPLRPHVAAGGRHRAARRAGLGTTSRGRSPSAPTRP
jgi:hypothetical protein